jgi:hypothetical protein
MLRRSPLLWQLPVFFALALVAIAGALPSGRVVGEGVDLYGTLWFYWWQLDCLRTGVDPGFTDLFFHPLGKDIFAHTGNNLVDAKLSVPFQLLWGYPDYQKWFVATLLVANGLAFRPLAREVLGEGSPAFLASLAWMINPFTLFELHCGRPTQALVVFVPLAFLGMVRLEKDTSWKWPLLAGAMVAAQAWTYWFMGWFLALAFVPLAFYGLRESKDRTGLVKRWAVAGGVCAVLVGPAAWAMAAAASAGDVPGLAAASNSLFSVPEALANNVSPGLHGYDLLEQHDVSIFGTLAWGLPVLVWAWKGPHRTPWLGVLLVALVFSVGPSLEIHALGLNLVMPHYMALYRFLPFFDRLWFPYRLVGIAMVPASLALGALLVQWQARKRGGSALWIAAFLGIGLGEQARDGHFPLASMDMAPPPTVRWLADEEGALIHLPFGVYGEQVAWMAVHEHAMFGGMAENAPLLWPEGFRERLKNRFVQRLVHAVRGPFLDEGERGGAPAGDARAHREALSAEGFRWVVLDRELAGLEVARTRRRLEKEDKDPVQVAQEQVAGLVDLLGPPSAVDGALVTWHLHGVVQAPGALAATEERLADTAWVEGFLDLHRRDHRPPPKPSTAGTLEKR